MEWLLKNHRNLVDAEFVLNADSGGVTTAQGKLVNVDVEASEKQYADFELTVLNAGGHSSLPTPDNAIYRLAAVLTRLERSPFPLEFNAVTRTYFERRAPLEAGQMQADMKAILRTPPDTRAVARLSAVPRYNSMLRTTCVATRLSAGHANNALPQEAKAIVNCRILPGHSPAETQQTLIRVVADPQVAVKYLGADGGIIQAPDSKGFPTVLPSDDVLRPLQDVTAEMWPESRLFPSWKRCIGQRLHDGRGHSQLRRARRGNRPGRCPRARQGRTHSSQRLRRRRRVLLPVLEGSDEIKDYRDACSDARSGCRCCR